LLRQDALTKKAKAVRNSGLSPGAAPPFYIAGVRAGEALVILDES